jgi:hypothetical protein
MAHRPNMDPRPGSSPDPVRSDDEAGISDNGRVAGREVVRVVPADQPQTRDMSYGVQFFTVWVGRLGVQPVCSYTPLGWLH